MAVVDPRLICSIDASGLPCVSRVLNATHQHIRSTPGYPDGNWPPHTGMTLEKNLGDLRRHADDFARGVGFTFTVLDPRDNDVIGCVYRVEFKDSRRELGLETCSRSRPTNSRSTGSGLDLGRPPRPASPANPGRKPY